MVANDLLSTNPLITKTTYPYTAEPSRATTVHWIRAAQTQQTKIERWKDAVTKKCEKRDFKTSIEDVNIRTEANSTSDIVTIIPDMKTALTVTGRAVV